MPQAAVCREGAYILLGFAEVVPLYQGLQGESASSKFGICVMVHALPVLMHQCDMHIYNFNP